MTVAPSSFLKACGLGIDSTMSAVSSSAWAYLSRSSSVMTALAASCWIRRSMQPEMRARRSSRFSSSAPSAQRVACFLRRRQKRLTPSPWRYLSERSLRVSKSPFPVGAKWAVSILVSASYLLPSFGASNLASWMASRS